VETSKGKSTFLHHVIRIFCAASRASAVLSIRVALLQVLISWMQEFPPAVNDLLDDPSSFVLLVEQIKTADTLLTRGICAHVLGLSLVHSEQVAEDNPAEAESVAVIDVIVKRVGLELFADTLDEFTKSEEFHLVPDRLTRSDVIQLHLFDHRFANSIIKENKIIKQEIIHAFLGSKTGPSATKECMQVTQDDFQAIVESYKSLIRQQDTEVKALRAELAQMKDADTEDHCLSPQSTELTAERLQSASLDQKNQQLQTNLREAEAQRAKLEEDLQLMSITLNDLETACFQKDTVINQQKQKLKNQNSGICQSSDDEISELRMKIQALEAELNVKSVPQNVSTEQEKQPNEVVLQEDLIALQEQNSALMKKHTLLLVEHKELLICLGELEMEKNNFASVVRRGDMR